MTSRRPGARLCLYILAIVTVALFCTACISSTDKESPELGTAAATKTVQFQVSSLRDNAEERRSGLVVNSSSDLELTRDAERSQQLVGLRFRNVEVPRSAKIEKAYIQFQADETNTGYLRVQIQGEDADNAAGFTQGRKWSVSQRPRTSASALWTVPDWERGERGSEQRTPDLSGILQEIFGRKGWRNGNAVAFVVLGGDRENKRVAESYRGDKEGAPTLVIEYSQEEREPQPAPPLVRGNRGVPVILDTDMGVDVDDAGALATLHALADLGEADILATVSSVHDPYASAAIDAVNTYYGRPDIPVGRNADSEQLPVATPWWRDHKPRFVRELAKRFPNDVDTSEVPSAVSVYRKTLEAQPDNSVTVVTVGFMSNLADLLASKPDEHSNLDGKTLVERKVKELVVMGGTYPRSNRDLNLKGSKGKVPPTEAIRVLEGWPTTTTFAAGSVCGAITTGQTLARETSKDNPIREAYRLFANRSGVGRASWDLCPVLYAVRGLSDSDDTYFDVSRADKRLELDESGNSQWVSPGNGRHRRLARELPKDQMATLLESLVTAPPKR